MTATTPVRLIAGPYCGETVDVPDDEGHARGFHVDGDFGLSLYLRDEDDRGLAAHRPFTAAMFMREEA